MLLGKQSRCYFEWPSAVVESGISPNVRSCQRRRRFGAASHVRSVVRCTDDDWQKANLFSTPSLNFLHELSSQALLDVHLKAMSRLEKRHHSRLQEVNDVPQTSVNVKAVENQCLDPCLWCSTPFLCCGFGLRVLVSRQRKFLRIPKNTSSSHRVSIDVNVFCCNSKAHWSTLKHGTRSRHVPTTYTFSPCVSD